MIRITKLFAIAGLSILLGLNDLAARAQNANPREVLWYRTPAPVLDHALPIGNGRLPESVQRMVGTVFAMLTSDESSQTVN